MLADFVFDAFDSLLICKKSWWRINLNPGVSPFLWPGNLGNGVAFLWPFGCKPREPDCPGALWRETSEKCSPSGAAGPAEYRSRTKGGSQLWAKAYECHQHRVSVAAAMRPWLVAAMITTPPCMLWKNWPSLASPWLKSGISTHYWNNLSESLNLGLCFVMWSLWWPSTLNALLKFRVLVSANRQSIIFAHNSKEWVYLINSH